MIIQSFWSKPFLKNSNHPNARFKGGWLDEKYFYYSIALSCLKFKEHYGEITLYTDEYGKKILGDILDLPYTEIHTTLDELNEFDANLWALPKLHTYSLQNKPFIHVDTDVFIWEKFPEAKVNGAIFCQNIEDNYPVYQETLDAILKIFDFVPTEIINSLYNNKRILAFNAGVIGGSNTEYYKKLHAKALEMIHKNEHLFPKIDVGMFNMIFEQFLGHAIASKNEIEIHPLLENVDPNFSKLTNFHLAGFQTNYVHAIGYAKKSLHACEQIEALLMYEYPEAYENITKKGIEYSLWENRFEISERRKKYLFTVYGYLRSNDIETLYKTKFKLNPTVKFTERETTSVLEFISPQMNKVEILELVDWENLVFYFEEEISTADLCNQLLTDDDIKQTYTPSQLQEKVFSFIIDKCILQEILIPEIFQENDYKTLFLSQNFVNSAL
ncbi:DUF6734 family protein [uncultured Tenacibaculum sp.]|uniref:DUF6734 family protein n=1 Tax=uncultured Tenacibaculum sp. TaxID=174713 RepID=UPI002623CEE4|nr:DUF6734 family protein [uncultured Tenacibaculum sp.]